MEDAGICGRYPVTVVIPVVVRVGMCERDVTTIFIGPLNNSKQSWIAK